MTDTVRIGDREFRVRATYAPKSGKGRSRILSNGRAPRTGRGASAPAAPGSAGPATR